MTTATTLADAAAEANELAEQGSERELADLRSKWGEELDFAARSADYRERVVQTNLSRISEAMKLFRSWATTKGLSPSETHYVARTPRRQALRFSKSGNPTIEKLYRTHWISSELSERRRERLVERASRAPELLVIQTSFTCPVRSISNCI